MDTTKEYWLALETYVYVERKGDRVMLYNTLDGKCLFSNDPDINKLIEKINTPENTGVVAVSSGMLQNENIRRFVENIREFFMGDLYEQTLFREKPVQPYPFLKFNRDVRKLKEIEGRSIGENILSTISKVDVYLNKPEDETVFPLKLLEGLLHQIEFCKVDSLRFYFYDEDRYDQWNELEKLVRNYRHVIRYVFQLASFLPEILKKVAGDREIVFSVSRQLYQEDRLREKIRILPEVVRKRAMFLFPVASEEEFEYVTTVVEEWGLDFHHINPVYTGDNLPFLEEAVFMDEEDLASEPVSLKEIYMHQTLNVHDFGHLVCYPNGDVYANEYFPKIGNLKEESVYTLVYRELDEGKSWLRTRQEAPCCQCLYQWICPSPSGLEMAVGKPNLCKMKL